jgi:hypothetical protein
MYVFSVSPQYLRHLKSESEDYKFKFQGYGNFEDACAGLMKTNASEFYGFVILFDSLPQSKSKLTRFIKLCDMISENSPNPKRMVFGVKDEKDLLPFIKALKTKHLELYYAKFEILTDTFIKKELFGTILDSYLRPYGERNSSAKILTKGASLKGLKYEPVLSGPVLDSLSPVEVHDTVTSTITRDRYLSELKSTNDFLYKLRLFKIRRCFPDEPLTDLELESIIESLADVQVRTRYRLLYTQVKEGGV